MKEPRDISLAVINRLPRYYRFLSDLLRHGRERISSKELSERMGITASQIRQDLNNFGGFGQQGYGYNIPMLRDELADILGLTASYKAIIIGAGNLGSALVNYNIFSRTGIELLAVFDISPDIIGSDLGGFVVRHAESAEAFCREHRVDIAALTVPRSEATSVAEKLDEAGVHGFWNFSNGEIPPLKNGALVHNVHLIDSLMTLCYKLVSEKKDG
jgi:redox-sensing transcriptional repressor